MKKNRLIPERGYPAFRLTPFVIEYIGKGLYFTDIKNKPHGNG